jgi:hypothetical protein
MFPYGMGTKNPRLLSDAMQMGCVILVTCRACHNTASIIPRELFKLYNANRALETLRFRCRCGSKEVRQELRTVR